MDEDRVAALEEKLAHLQRVADDLSDEVASQAREITLLKRRLGMLMEKEAEREAEASNTIPLADQKPPHW
ncbi:SlyX family protein [Pseudoruegeria sp. HB172150]|uniref:SlyX family protein n=1 Tax=Pseudoruegeria sp. HB172150 TaxID=2721164 RepID=UPI0015573292|nr:SlyX family protein [Pseudoruegeria sp. HB172150]